MADFAFSSAPVAAPSGESPQARQIQQMLAAKMLEQSQGAAPIQSPWQGVAKMTEALVGGLSLRRQQQTEMQQRAQAAWDTQNAILKYTGGDPSSLGPRPTVDMNGSIYSGLFGGGSPSPASAGTGGGGPVASMTPAAGAPMPKGPIADYIQQAAAKRGIDPGVALHFANLESGLNPNNPGDRGPDGRPSSFNLFQLHYGGINPNMPHPGMGDDFTKATGIHASDPNAWKNVVDYSLDRASKEGWGAWANTRNKLGVGNWTGIGQRTSAADMPAPNAQPASLDLPPGKTGFGPLVDGATAEGARAFGIAPPAPVIPPPEVLPQGPQAGDFGMMGSAAGPQPAPVVSSRGPLPGDAGPIALPPGLGGPSAPLGAGDLGTAPPMAAGPPIAPPAPPQAGPGSILPGFDPQGISPQASGPVDPSIIAQALAAAQGAGPPPAAPQGFTAPSAIPPQPDGSPLASDQPQGNIPPMPIPPPRPPDLGMAGAPAGPAAAAPPAVQAALAQAIMGGGPSGRNSMNATPTQFNVAQANGGRLPGVLPPAPVAVTPTPAIAPPQAGGASPGGVSPVSAPGAPPASADGRGGLNSGAIAALTSAMSNPYLSPGQSSVLGSILQSQLTPHKIEMVKDDASGITHEIDSVSGREVGQVGTKKLPTFGVIGKDMLGNEQYGWNDPVTGKITPYSGGGGNGSGLFTIPPADGSAPPAPAPNSGGSSAPPENPAITGPAATPAPNSGGASAPAVDASTPSGALATKGSITDPNSGAIISAKDFGPIGGSIDEGLLHRYAAQGPTQAYFANQARMIIMGRAPYPSDTNTAGTKGEALVLKNLISQAAPDYSVAGYNSRVKALDDMQNSDTATSKGGLIRNGNTTLNHLASLSNNAELLGGSDSSYLPNSIVNEGVNATSFGPRATALKAYSTNVSPVVEEVLKYYTGGAAALADREELERQLAPSSSPSEKRQAIATMHNLIMEKNGEIQRNWHQAAGPGAPDYPVLGPEALNASHIIQMRDPQKPIAQIRDESDIKYLPPGKAFTIPDGPLKGNIGHAPMTK